MSLIRFRRNAVSLFQASNCALHFFPSSQNVFIRPLPLTLVSPRSSKSNMRAYFASQSCLYVSLQWILRASPVDSIREAVLTVSPKLYVQISLE